MTKINHIEIYKQRYETFRHLDKLKWQMFQIAITIGPISLAVAEKYNQLSWGLLSVSIVWIILGLVMNKIQKGILRNGKTLQSAASKIGDLDIPNDNSKRKMISEWVSKLLIVFGFVGIILSICLAS